MTPEDIQNSMMVRSEVERDLFLRLVSASKGGTKNCLIAMANGYCNKINESLISDHRGYLQAQSLDDFIIFAKDYYAQEQRTFEYRFFVKPFSNLLIRLSAMILELNGDYLIKLYRTNDPLYDEIGIIALCAGCYLLLKD